MSYVLVNGNNRAETLQSARFLKGELELLSNQEVVIVEDFGSNNPVVQKLLAELLDPSTTLPRVVSMLMTMRRSLIRDLILPLRERNALVLYVGGVLDDSRYFKNYPGYSFEQMLKENQEILQALGGVAYPKGAVFMKSKGSDHRTYFNNLRRLKASMADLKTLTFNHNRESVELVKAMF